MVLSGFSRLFVGLLIFSVVLFFWLEFVRLPLIVVWAFMLPLMLTVPLVELLSCISFTSNTTLFNKRA